MLVDDKCAERRAANGWLALGPLIGSCSGALVTYLRFLSTEEFFKEGAEGGGGSKEKIRMTQSMTAIFFTAGGQGPQ